MKKGLKRFLAILLTTAMVLNIGPVSTIVNALVDGVKAIAAEEDTDYLFFATDRHTNTSIIATMINNMESKIGENKLEYLGLGGDMVGSGNSHPTYNSSTVLGEVTGATTSLSAANVDIVAGIHDMNVNDDAGIVLPYSGGGAQIYEGDKYYVYGVPEGCISDEVSDVDPETEANDFVTWANGSDIDKSKVIIVLSHYPLHQRRNDNDGAVYWASALNTVAVGDDTAIDRDVVFFWGHNHTGESSADTAVYHVAPNGSISVQGGSSSQTIYFTYANAGYLNAKSSATLMSITDTEITFEKYVNSSVSTTNSVTRVVTETPVTPSTLAVTGVTEYTVGDALQNPSEIVVTYSDGSTKSLSATDLELTITTEDGADLSDGKFAAAGTYNLTYSYTESGQTATATLEVTVKEASTEPTENTVTYADNLITIQATALGLTAIEAENVWGEPDLSGTFSDYVTYDVTLTGHTDGNEVFYSMLLVDEMDTTNLALYYVAEDGTLTAVPFELVTDEQGNQYVEFTTTYVGTFAYGALTVPAGYTLTGLEVTNIETTKYFVGDSLNMVNAVVTAIYTNEVGETYTATVFDAYDLTFDMNVVGKQNVTVSYTEGDVTVSDTFEIEIFQKVFPDETTGVSAEVNVHGATAITVVISTNENVATAVADVMKEGTYVAYDIELAGYNDGETVTVTLPIPEGVENPVVYYVSDDGATVTNMNATMDEDGTTVSFETDHFSTYVVGNSSALTGTEKDDTVPGQNGVTTYDVEEVTVYKLVTSPVSGKQYLIVNSNTGAGYGLDGDTTGYATTAFTGEGYYSDWDDTTDTGTAFSVGSDVYLTTDGAYLWTAGDNSFTIGYDRSFSWGSYSYSLNPSSSTSGSWGLSENWLSITLSDDIIGYGETTYYLTNSSTSWSMSTTAANVYFYEPVTVYKVTASTTDVPETTYHMDVTYNGTETQEITAAFIKSGDTLQLGAAFTPSTPAGGSYTVTSSNTNVATVDNNGLVTFTGTEGETLIQATYTWTENGNTYSVSNYVTIVVTGAIYTLEIDNGDSHIEKGVTSSSTKQLTATVTVQTSETETSTVENPTITWEILAEESDANVATINKDTGLLTFTGNEGTIKVQASYTVNGKEYVDLIEVTARKSTAVTPGESTTDFPRWPNEGAVRFDKTATAVGNFSETGIAQVELSMAGIPIKRGGAIDVVVMLDMTGSMSTNGMTAAEEATVAFVEKIVKNEDGTYNDNRVAVYAFNSGSSSPYELVALTAIKSDDALTTANTAIRRASTKQASGGTPFDEATKQCYDVLQAAKSDGTGDNRQQFCVFMSDGGPTTYYGSDEKTYYGGNNNSGDVKLTSCMEGYSSSTSSDWSFTLPTEYYTDQMKADGVTVYTVGLLLQTAPSNPAPYSSMTDSTYDSTTDSLTTIGSHYYFTSSILKQMATDESKYIDIFNVDNADNAVAKFESIAEEISAAATNVVVEDVITDEYDLIFELPNSSIKGLPDGQEFYIEVVDYPLNETTHERTGASAIKQRIYLATDTDGKVYISKITYTDDSGEVVEQNITPVYTEKANETDKAYFDANGAYYPDGDGTHNMTSGAYVALNDDGSLKSLHTVYFTYVVAAKQLNWTVASMSQTSETALRYFVYLKNSGGVDAADQIDAGTYPTNKYATLTYTNHLGTECEQTFPVPQMTWNGAQVSYVFYLVNENGVPVNRAGREITFAEAIFVTDIHTFAIMWNDLEQAAGLEASYLAENLLPSAYSLYDENAFYKIHVYEDEVGVNLNNHFIIGGTSEDETTYVYNNKADVTKYNKHGTYAATSTYLCKSYSVTATVENGVITAATYTAVSGETQVATSGLSSTTGATIIDGYAYYIDENGDVYTIVQKTDATAISGFDFANTTVAFAVTWEKKLVEDTVVVDFGLPVDIDVVSNDFVYNYISGIGATDPNYGINEGYKTDAGALTATELTVNGHSVKVQDQNHIRFTPSSMEFKEPAVFYYETTVEVYENSRVVPSYMYSKVTVIPATTVYYEDSFIDFKTQDSSGKEIDNQWTTEGTITNATQDQDRPGASQISAALDADNNYGYDSAYVDKSTFSMGSAAKITVDSSIRGIAEFSFYGTGFDIIGLTSNTTGTLIVQVYDSTNTLVKTLTVNTYYGYAYGDSDGDGDSEWYAVDSSSPNALYQVPVMQLNGLAYGKYTVKLTAAYNSYFDKTGDGEYTLYLDAVRIYDPCGSSNGTANDAYVADGEAYPEYTELRNQIITAETFNSLNSDSTESVRGIVFIDGATTDPDETVSISDYTSYGPNNELYLANSQAIAFDLNATAANGSVKSVQLAIKTVGGTGSVEVYGVDSNGNKTACLSETISTATDMYYDITALNGKTVVIKNSGDSDDAIVSLTNIKVTYTEAQTTGETTETETTVASYSLLSISRSSASYALMSLSAGDEDVEETESETIVPDTEPETETTEAETETSEPETTESETEVTEPETEETESEVTESEAEETESETTEPETEETTSETTESEEESETESSGSGTGDTENIINSITNMIKNVANTIKNLFSKWFR